MVETASSAGIRPAGAKADPKGKPKRNCLSGKVHRAIAVCFIAAVGMAATPASAARIQSVEDLGRLSIEELANIKVTSVSKRPQALSRAPASVYVITSEDIRRSGAVSIPEVLRLAPNLQVTRVDAQSYAISARGFNSFQAATKQIARASCRERVWQYGEI